MSGDVIHYGVKERVQLYVGNMRCDGCVQDVRYKSRDSWHIK